jgi:hypothetical protein
LNEFLVELLVWLMLVLMNKSLVESLVKLQV